MKLFATMCNQPQRLLEALTPARAALVARPPVARWGLGYVQSGEVLLARTPRPSAQPIDLFAALDGVKSDCVLGHAVRGGAAGDGFGGTEDTPPFRYRRWMYVQDAPPAASWTGALFDRIAAGVPEFLRRSIKGKGLAEVAFHVLLAELHDLGGLDDPNLPLPTLRRAVAAASARVAVEVGKVPGAEGFGSLAVSNSRSMLLARLGSPLWLRRLHVTDDRGARDEQFRGVLAVSATADDVASADGFEEIPAGSAVTVTRDLRVDVVPLT